MARKKSAASPKCEAFDHREETGPMRPDMGKGNTHLDIIGLAIQPNARKLIDDTGAMGVPATYVRATPDLVTC
jgi:hypothetical protein